MPREEVQKVPEIVVLFVSKRGCGICELFRPVFRRLKDDKPQWIYTENHMNTDIEAKMAKQMYPDMTMTPFTVLMVDSVVKGSINGTLRYKDYLKTLDEFASKT